MMNVPILLSSLMDDMYGPANLLDQNFGLGMVPEDFFHPTTLMRMPLSRGYYRPWRHIRGKDSGISNIASTNDEFKVNLDVQQFKPEQLSVKVVDNSVVIEGKHEERQDEHGFISRQFQRRYILPESVDPQTVVSSLSSDGVLSISAPKKLPPPAQNERVVPIVQTRQPAIQQKSEKQKTGGAEGENMES
ncbi:UNVERIFIED_CONTAM: hypothetical protein PYX00_004093 [Menopon gallinae]|uniref:SHSP domain-containing protein n=1 Tax=Menopon gallinae TaxID=328185 RepID=A0AAW2I3Y9_9NEOP